MTRRRAGPPRFPSDVHLDGARRAVGSTPKHKEEPHNR
jgi:hypothetical protein